MLLWAGVLLAQSILPLRDVKPGMRGVGKTVFSGEKIEEFQVEILGVMENTGPKQSVILGRLSGGPLAASGVMQGMSGSPVYIDGKLVGAVALAFEFSKEPIAGIRPIEEMLRAAAPVRRVRTLDQLAAARPQYQAGEGARLVEIATPLAAAGFTRGTLDQFTPQLRALGLSPMQGALGGGSARNRRTPPPPIQPGSMISVQLISGDLSMGADGTVTHLDGNKIYAFGHRFLSMGPTEMPFARAEVLTLLPNIHTSFKISAAREWAGSITGDHSTAVTGELGRRAALVPVKLSVEGRDGYQMEIVRDKLLTPFLLQVATYSAIDATERITGAATVALRGKIRFDNGSEARIDNIYAGETNVPLAASLGGAIPLSYAMQSGFDQLLPRAIDLEIHAVDDRRLLRVDQLWTSRSRVRPGERFEIHVLLSGPGGVEIRRKTEYQVPIGAVAGPLQISASDAMTANLTEFAATLTHPPETPERVVEILNGLRPNSAVTVRVGRTDPGFIVRGRQLPDPPASLALLLRNDPGTAAPAASSRLAEFPFPIEGWSISGNRTTTVEVQD
jgi:hypothetical protein